MDTREHKVMTLPTTAQVEALPGSIERFMELVVPEPNSGCWLWLGAASRIRPYGFFWNGVRSVRAHRHAYEIFVGPIPDGLTIDHLCRVHCCVNPKHLEAVSSRDNTLRGIGPTAKRARQTHCMRGHEFSESNTTIRTDYRDGSKGRVCRTCETERQQRAYLKKKRRKEGLT